MPNDTDTLTKAIREAAERAFAAVREDHPDHNFYYFALVTTADALRPGPSASSVEGLERVVGEYEARGSRCTFADLRWSEADSPFSLYGDEHFAEVERLLLAGGDHRTWPLERFRAEVVRRFAAMESALGDLDRSGFFGTGPERHRVVLNVMAPGDETEQEIIARARRLNPPESLRQLIADLLDPS